MYINDIPLYGYTVSFSIINLWTFLNSMSNAAENICRKFFFLLFLSDMFLFLLDVYLWDELLDHCALLCLFSIWVVF